MSNQENSEILYKIIRAFSNITHRKMYLALFVVVCLGLTLIHQENYLLNILYPMDDSAQIGEIKFIVSSSRCKIPDLEPFNKDAKKFFNPEIYQPCRSLKLLTYVTKINNIAILHIDENVIPSYTNKGVSCCYANVTRKNNRANPDAEVSYSTCEQFEHNVTIYSEPVLVKCVEMVSPFLEVYENVHVSVVMKDEVQKQIDNFNNTVKPFSILFIGIDSISRLNFIRSLPETYKFVEENGWLPLKGYNKIDDNTFPNIMAILTGENYSHICSFCNPKTIGKLDNCSILWNDFRRFGFVTAFAEDECKMHTFNYHKKGFKLPPVHYYYRPYTLATENLAKVYKDGMIYCTGPESSGERIMNVAKDFVATFKEYPYFGIFWMNSFSHNKINSPTGMDNIIKEFLEDLTNTGVTDNSIVIFLSDHGIRFGGITLTDTGWLEQRLPFFYVSFPRWFQENYSLEYVTFKNNSHRLTSPYDLYMTLKHILVLSGRNLTVESSGACPKCKSLFEEIDSERSCEDAGIPQHWCTCTGYISTTLDTNLRKKCSSYVLEKIHDVIQSRKGAHLCTNYYVENILETKISQKFLNDNESFLLLKFKTRPEAVFEATISFIGDIEKSNFSLSGDISRLDNYDKHSKCVNDAYLKKYCYCHSGMKKN